MPNPYFQFKNFTVRHDRCPMKVGTDGTLLGAWVPLDGAHRVLDVGTGCGLIALMVAQRCAGASVVGVDNDLQSVSQAKENALLSPWRDRIEVFAADFREMRIERGCEFDVIVSNPPFYEEDVECPNALRNSARHTSSLSFHDLTSVSSRLIAENGSLSVVVPANASQSFMSAAVRNGFYLTRMTTVHTKIGKPPKRALISFSKSPVSAAFDDLCILDADGKYTPDYASLMKDFYLWA